MSVAADEAGAVLLLQDRTFAGMALSRLLLLSGYEVTLTGSPERTLALVAERVGEPTVVLVDMAESRDACTELVRAARASDLDRWMRVVGLARLERETDASFDGLGLEAVVDTNALPEELFFRLNEAVHGATEARRYIRVFTHLDAACSCAGREFVGMITNLGKGGAFVQTDEEVRPDDRCTVRFELPSGPVAGEGRVRFRTVREPIGGHIQLTGFGLELTRLDGDGLERVARFAAARQSEWRALLGGR